MKLSHWPIQERPREKLLLKGADALSDAELLAIFLRTGLPGMTAVDLARLLLAEFGSLRGLLSANCEDFCAAHGLGPVKYAQLHAAIEIAHRYVAEPLSRHSVFDSVASTRRFLVNRLRDEKNEVFAVLFLDTQHRLICFKKLFFGTINEASVYPRVIVQSALGQNAAAVILAHNHPSGVAEPSMADRSITDKIVAALRLVDIRVLDHVVVGDGVTVSFAERGYL